MGDRRRIGLWPVLAACVLLNGCTLAPSPPGISRTDPEPADQAPPDPSTAPSMTPATTPVAGSARAVLGTLAVKGRAPRTGYDRSQFGQAWSDVDRNGCDTRNDVLRRDLVDIAIRPGTRSCVVLSGTLLDPYTGETVPFVRGVASSRAVQIDHVVALGDAWQKGAQLLSAQRRRELANDPRELLAVGGRVNQAKGDGDAATWLPPSRSFRCAYVARQIGVKAEYGLWVTAAERDAMARVLDTCPDQAIPPS